jgi:hypothetical protein
LLCLLSVSPAVAQSTREEWLALRQRKQARQALAAPATVTGPLSIVNIRFFADAAGRLVGVGEVRNDSTRSLAYTRLEFAFYGSTGALVGAELTYVQGGFNARILDHVSSKSGRPFPQRRSTPTPSARPARIWPRRCRCSMSLVAVRR